MTSPADTADSSVLPDIVSGAGIALWYSLPDYTSSRRTRAVVKTGIIAASAAYGAHVLRSRTVSPDDGGRRPVMPHRANRQRGNRSFRVPVVQDEARKAALIGLAVVLLGSTAAVTVSMERVVYRLGERLSGRGVRLAHTRIGVALAVLSTLATLGGDALRNRRRGA